MLIIYINKLHLKKIPATPKNIAKHYFSQASFNYKNIQCNQKIQHVLKLEKINHRDLTISQRLFTLYTIIGDDLYKKKKYTYANLWYEKTLGLKHINLRYINNTDDNTDAPVLKDYDAPVLKYYKDNSKRSIYAYLNEQISYSKK